MVLYSKFAYGSQFSEEKNDLTILHLVAKILGKNPVSFFLGRPVYGGDMTFGHLKTILNYQLW